MVQDSQAIDLKKFAERFDIFATTIWVKNNKPITLVEIAEYVERNDTIGVEKAVEMELIWDISSRETHLKRIAWFVKNWSDDFPIDIDFGIPSLGYFVNNPIQDGHHRLYAAYFLKKESIEAFCSGAVSEIEQYLYEVCT